MGWQPGCLTTRRWRGASAVSGDGRADRAGYGPVGVSGPQVRSNPFMVP